MIQIHLPIFIFSLFFISCNQNRSGATMSKQEESNILSEEIDDDILEHQVSSARNQTKNLLQLELATSLGLKEIYLHEEPLAINFIDQNENLVLFETISIKDSEIEKYIESQYYSSNIKINELRVDDKIITYSIEERENSTIVHSIVRSNDAEMKVKMNIISTEKDVINKFVKLINFI